MTYADVPLNFAYVHLAGWKNMLSLCVPYDPCAKFKRSGFSLVGRWQIKEAKTSNDINAEALDGGPIVAGTSEEIKKKWP